MKTEISKRVMLQQKNVLMVLIILLMLFNTQYVNGQKVLKGMKVPAGAPPPPPLPPPLPDGFPDYEIFGNDTIYIKADIMPQYPGGDAALLEYLVSNTKYPDSSKETAIQGRVIIRFCVSENGKVEKVSVLKSLYPELDLEAERVVNSLQKFRPGLKNGERVKVWYIVPITFALR